MANPYVHYSEPHFCALGKTVASSWDLSDLGTVERHRADGAVLVAWKDSIKSWCFPHELELPMLETAKDLAAAGIEDTDGGNPHDR